MQIVDTRMLGATGMSALKIRKIIYNIIIILTELVQVLINFKVYWLRMQYI